MKILDSTEKRLGQTLCFEFLIFVSFCLFVCFFLKELIQKTWFHKILSERIYC